MSNVTALPTSASRGVSERAWRSVPKDDQTRRNRAASADRGQRPQPGPDRVDSLTDQVVKLRCPFGQSRRRDHVRRRVDQLARSIRPPRDERRAVGDRRERFVAPADHEALDRGWRLVAAPAASVVATDDGALGQRTHLLRGREGQRFIEYPGDCASTPGRAHRPCRGGPQALDGRLQRDDRERHAGVAGTRYTTATGSASATARSGAPSADARVPGATATRSAPIVSGSAAVTSMTNVRMPCQRLALRV